jgi:DNA-binding NtrC family response regulator
MKKSWVSSAFSDDQSPSPLASNVAPRATRATKKTSVATKTSSSASSSSTTSVAAKLTPMISKLIKTEQQVNNSSKKISSLTRCPLIEKYRPKTRSELAVHKTKIEQLSNLIDQITMNKKNGSILIIEGPPGCGKNVSAYNLIASFSFKYFKIIL